MTIEWEDLGKAAGRFFLGILEYSFKLCALVAAGIAAGTGGTFATKISNGFGSLTFRLRQMVDVPGTLMEMGTVIRDYNSQSPAVFNELHGADAASHLLYTLDVAIQYFMKIYDNFYRSPLVTTAAMLTVFLAFYLLAWILRFTRHGGRGSLMARFERKLADKAFNKTPVIPKPKKPATRESATKTSANVIQKSKAGTRTASTADTSDTVPTKKRRPNVKKAGRNKKAKRQKKPKPGRKNSKPKEKDFAPDSDTLSYLLESARTS